MITAGSLPRRSGVGMFAPRSQAGPPQAAAPNAPTIALSNLNRPGEFDLNHKVNNQAFIRRFDFFSLPKKCRTPLRRQIII